MKRVIAITAVFLLLFTGCSSDIPGTEECALCVAFPKLAPCLINLNSGAIRELEIYQPHHTNVAELSDEQYGGYLSLVQFGEISGILLGADRVELNAPIKSTGMQDGLFCNDCRKLLKENNCQGYILADLRNPDTPSVWQIKDGVSFSVRCYEIDITASDDGEKITIVMKGTLKID